jgi:malate dehydrogenase (oxaloacetate-decarboxylating)
MPGITSWQAPFVQSQAAVSSWKKSAGEIGLADVVANAHPTVLIGVSGQFGAFTEQVVRQMAQHVERPVIFPLSNPTSRSEATLEQLVTWTEGRALVGTGSPFKPVQWKGVEIPNNQTNNSYIFPGMGLGILAVGAKRVTDAMFMAAGKAVAALSPARSDPKAKLLPPVDQLREVAAAVACAVARQAQLDGVADFTDAAGIEARVKDYMWEPRYRPYSKS